MNERNLFYERTVSELIKNKKASILVCGGSALDKNIFSKLGFQNVTISNIDSRMKRDEYKPYAWKYENAEHLSFPNESFDYVVIHAAIHHVASPHKVLTEMYRTAKLGVLAFEPRDTFITRCIKRIGFTQSYEATAVYYNNCKYGGLNNTEIPNYIYRWTEREIEKTIQSYAPCFNHKYIYRRGTAFPCAPELEKKSKFKQIVLMAMRPLYNLFTKFFPKQKNLLAFFIEKPKIPDNLFPWLSYDEKEKAIRFNREWGDKKFRNPKTVTI